MLQQTTTAAVGGYYRRFLDRFPDVKSLAEADLAEVYRLWEGLGYYRRAAQLHRAAAVVLEQYGGTFPEDFEAVLNLPGIGRYTAGAILSIAFEKRRPILEANTIRLHARLLGLRSDPAQSETNALLWEMAEKVLPKKAIGDFNQALMDLGSRVCLPKRPACLCEKTLWADAGSEGCPLVSLCRCAEAGLQNEIPAPKKKPTFEETTEIAVLLRRGKKVLLLRYPEGVRWAGLWDFPRFREDRPEMLSQMTGRNIVLGRTIATLRHTVTRFKITLRFFEGTDLGRCGKAAYETRWVSLAELKELPLNSTGRQLAESLADG